MRTDSAIFNCRISLITILTVCYCRQCFYNKATFIEQWSFLCCPLPAALQIGFNDCWYFPKFKCNGMNTRHTIFFSHLFNMIHDMKGYTKFMHDYWSFFLNFSLMDCFTIFGMMYFSFSSDGCMMDAPGSSRCKWIASNTHFVVHTPQPIHLFGSTTEAPQERHLEVSFLTCSSVKVKDRSRNVAAWSFSSGFSGIWRLEES